MTAFVLDASVTAAWLLPDEVALRDWAMAQILTVYRRHGFVRIETPAVESLRLLLRSDGGENEKLIFKILKRGEKLTTAGSADEMADLGLRFDLTVPLVRYYAQNQARLPQPLKAIQIGPVWRAERPGPSDRQRGLAERPARSDRRSPRAGRASAASVIEGSNPSPGGVPERSARSAPNSP